MFDNNNLFNKQRVFDGTFSVPYVAGTDDPDLFPIAVALDSPYHYAPIVIRTTHLGTFTSYYDLVVDIRMLAMSGTPASCDGQRNTVAVWRQVNHSDPNATVANYPSGGGPDHFALAMRVSGVGPNATAVSYGNGCLGTAGRPRCVTTNLPVLPSTGFTMQMLDGPPNAFSMLLLGTSQTNNPLGAYGLPGCRQLCGAELGALATLSNGSGVATKAIALPGAPWASGFPFTAQWAAIDAGANAAGMVVSDAQRYTARFR